jgi:copper chaperone CopZ
MNSQTITFKVNDMHCPSCPRLIQLDLEDKPGVVAVNADLKTKLVVAEFDPNSITTAELISSIEESGYTAKLL